MKKLAPILLLTLLFSCNALTRESRVRNMVSYLDIDTVEYMGYITNEEQFRNIMLKEQKIEEINYIINIHYDLNSEPPKFATDNVTDLKVEIKIIELSIKNNTPQQRFKLITKNNDTLILETNNDVTQIVEKSTAQYPYTNPYPFIK